MKTWDAIIIGGGIIGISLALDLGKFMERILVIDRGVAGREASYAAAGMLAAADPELPSALGEFARASAAVYPQFLEQLENCGGIHVELSTAGALYCHPLQGSALSPSELAELEPHVDFHSHATTLLQEGWLDPRQLMAAALQAAQTQQIEVRANVEATGLVIENGKATGVVTREATLGSGLVVNCCGAWAAQVDNLQLPVRPVKGQLLTVASPHGIHLTHVIRTPDVYLVPRSEAHILIGSTVEEAGFDKTVDPAANHRLLQLAADFLPALGAAEVIDSWAGLRPGTADDLPLIGETSVGNYYVSTGHFRNGILLAPASALALARLICGVANDWDISEFSPSRNASVS